MLKKLFALLSLSFLVVSVIGCGSAQESVEPAIDSAVETATDAADAAVDAADAAVETVTGDDN